MYSDLGFLDSGEPPRTPFFSLQSPVPRFESGRRLPGPHCKTPHNPCRGKSRTMSWESPGQLGLLVLLSILDHG